MKGFCFELIQIDGHSNEYSDYFFVIDNYEKARSVLKDSEYTRVNQKVLRQMR